MLAFVGGVACSACYSTAGPFITEIASTPEGDLVVERCNVQFTTFTKAVSTEDCETRTIFLFHGPPAARARPQPKPERAEPAEEEEEQ